MRVSSRVLVGCLALLGLGLTSQKAHATFQIQLSVDGGTFATVASGSDFQFGGISFSSANYLGTGLSIEITAATSHLGAGGSDLVSSTNLVSNTSGIAHTLVIRVTQTNYNLPVGPILGVESSLGGSFSGNVDLNDIFEGFADATNAVNGTGYSNGLQDGIANDTSFDTGSAIGSFTRGAGNFSLTTVTTLELDPTESIGYRGHIKLSPTPAPAGVILLASAIPVLGLRRVLRRKTVVA